jgi:hypothetical protein
VTLDQRFVSLAYAKLNLSFPKEEFIKEYDEKLLPHAVQITNGDSSKTNKLNAIWGMVPVDIYDTSDYYEKPGDITTLHYITRERRGWKMLQLMKLDTTNVTDPLIKSVADFGGVALRNVTLDSKYKFSLKPGCDKLKIVQWIYDSLPVEDIRYIHCVSLEPGEFATIHRDQLTLDTSSSSAGLNSVAKQGFVTICINITSGGSPLWYALDGKDIVNPFKADDPVAISNDYFVHGVGVCTERRRQIRVTARPTPELYELINQASVVDVGLDYQYDPRWLNYTGE